MILVLLVCSATGNWYWSLETIAALVLDLNWLQICVTVVLGGFVLTHRSRITLNPLFEGLLYLIRGQLVRVTVIVEEFVGEGRLLNGLLVLSFEGF